MSDSADQCAPAAMAQLAIVGEARKLGVDTLYSEKGHFAAAASWRKWNYFLGIPSAALSAIAGGSILNDKAGLVTGLVALLASALIALSTFLNPSERESQHQRAGVSYGRLRRLIRQFVQIDPFLPQSEDALRARLDELTENVSNLQAEAPAIPAYAYRAAIKEIEVGASDYTESELDSATGPRRTS